MKLDKYEVFIYTFIIKKMSCFYLQPEKKVV